MAVEAGAAPSGAAAAERGLALAAEAGLQFAACQPNAILTIKPHDVILKMC